MCHTPHSPPLAFASITANFPRYPPPPPPQGDIVRVQVDFERGHVLFGLNEDPPRLAVSRSFLPRSLVRPLRVHGAIQLTDITKPSDEPTSATVELGEFWEELA